MPKRISQKDEQSRRTRAMLIKAARKLFAQKGFSGTGTEEIIKSANVSRGALYHQYKDKKALFKDVFESVEQDLVKKISAELVDSKSPNAMLKGGVEVFLTLCRKPEIKQIALADAPSVLGWEVWREVESRHVLGLLQTVLQAAAVQALIDEHQVDDLSHLLLGAVSEAGMKVASDPKNEAAYKNTLGNLHWLIDRVFPQI